ncbi:hypothetical protein SELMODRAFT_429387 [Selaginella moellendorffii]|uniref:Uncharacterized protein n=1 Tax=Selaginella moellendorffii TaxID=88036 RepID=D8T609_SELML|nr:hypothetical protein SELMODRAFT_429387 [Selaginella moellendorffii]
MAILDPDSFKSLADSVSSLPPLKVILNDMNYILLPRNDLYLNPSDVVLTLTSGGCNALDLVLQGAKQVVAVDMNPAQSYLLELKRLATTRLSFEDAWKMFGEGVHPTFESLLERELVSFLSQGAVNFWRKKARWYGLTHSSSEGACKAYTKGSSSQNFEQGALHRVSCYAHATTTKRALVRLCRKLAITSWDFCEDGIFLRNQQIHDVVLCWSVQRPASSATQGGQLIQLHCPLSKFNSCVFTSPGQQLLLPLLPDWEVFIQLLSSFPGKGKLPQTQDKACCGTRSITKKRRHKAKAYVWRSFRSECTPRYVPGTSCLVKCCVLLGARVILMDHWLEQSDVDVLCKALQAHVIPGGRVIWRSASRSPSYANCIEKSGFKVIQVATSKASMDRVNMYASFFVAVRVGGLASIKIPIHPSSRLHEAGS